MFAVKDVEQSVYGSAFALIGGQPFVFTGGTKTEQIATFDARSPGRAVYSLATGNNYVQSLAFQSSTNSLWAATECMYVDRMGGHHDYRRAKLLKAPKAAGDDDDDAMADEWEDEDVDDDDFKDGDDDSAWPSRAWHNEKTFGYAFDSGEH